MYSSVHIESVSFSGNISLTINYDHKNYNDISLTFYRVLDYLKFKAHSSILKDYEDQPDTYPEFHEDNYPELLTRETYRYKYQNNGVMVSDF